MPDIRDITEPTQFLPEPATPWWYWALAAAILLLLITTAIIFLFKKHSTTRSRESHLETARSKLAKLKEEINTLPTQTLATRISVIVRSYLESAFEDPALFETNEEFTLRPTALQSLPPATREEITKFLHDLSHIKYTPDIASTSNLNKSDKAIQQAEELLALIELHPSPTTQ